MADYRNIIPFILRWEGGWVNNPSDIGGETNKGITYATWRNFFGDTHDRFLAMSQADWGTIFKAFAWDHIGGDQIQNQAIADFLADWYWGNGIYAAGHEYPTGSGNYYGLQAALNALGANLTIDGIVGPMTIAAINAADPVALLDELKAERDALYEARVEDKPDQAVFLQGWLNRANDLYNSVSSYIGNAAAVVINAATDNPKSTGLLLFFCSLVSQLWL